IGASTPVDESRSRELAEAEVRLYLAQSAALATFWSSPIDAESLRNEMARIARDTRFPDRLREIYAALGDGGALSQEWLARRTLADRLSRQLYAHDSRIHAGPRDEALTLRARLIDGRLALLADDPRRRIADLKKVRDASTRFLDERHVEVDLAPDAFAQW